MQTNFNVSCEDKTLFTPLSLVDFKDRIRSGKKVFLIKYRNCKGEIKDEDMIGEFLGQGVDVDRKPNYRFRKLYQRNADCPATKKDNPGKRTAIPSSYNYNWINLKQNLEKGDVLIEFFIKEKEIYEHSLNNPYANELIFNGFWLYDILKDIPSGGIQPTPVQPTPVQPPHVVHEDRFYSGEATIGGKKKKTVVRRKKQTKKKYTKRRRGK